MFQEHLIIDSQIKTLWRVHQVKIVKDILILIMIKKKYMKIMKTSSGLINFHKSKRRMINPGIINFVHLKMLKIITWTFKIIELIKL